MSRKKLLLGVKAENFGFKKENFTIGKRGKFQELLLKKERTIFNY